jgi:hypothetical protein
VVGTRAVAAGSADVGADDLTQLRARSAAILSAERAARVAALIGPAFEAALVWHQDEGAGTPNRWDVIGVLVAFLRGFPESVGDESRGLGWAVANGDDYCEWDPVALADDLEAWARASA